MITHPYLSPKTQSTDVTVASKTAWEQTHVDSSMVDLIGDGDGVTGCVGDGAANDSTAFSNKVGAAISSGKTRIFVDPRKIFLIDRYVLSSAVTLVFYGGGELRLRTASDSLLKCTNASGRIVLDGVKLNGNALSLTSNNNGLALATAGEVVVTGGTEIYNAGVAASGVGVGVATISGGRARLIAPYEIHDTAGYGVRCQGQGRFEVLGGYIHDTGDSNMFFGSNTPTVSDGITVIGPHCKNARADLGGAGSFGNSINFFKIDNFSILGAVMNSPAFSWLRVNQCNDFSVGPCNGSDAGDTGYFFELGATQFTITGLKGKNTQHHGISMTNVGSGAKSMIATGCEIVGYGLSAGTWAGILCENGMVSNCFVDGQNNPGACWNYKVSPGGGTSVSWQTQFESCQSAGSKYDVGVANSVTGGTQRMIIRGINNIRQDANYVSPIGAIAGGDTDGGNGSSIGATVYVNVFWDRNYFNVPTGQNPNGAEIGATMKINGAWKTWNGSAWA